MVLIFQTNMVIMSFLTNPIIDGIGEEANEGNMIQILTQLLVQPGGVFSFCQSFPMVRMFLSPPNLRVKPSWYPRFRPVILQTMLQLLGSRPSNLQILQDFSSDLEPDGIHFSIMGGVTFVQDLHDQSLALMSQPPPDVVLR